MAANIIKETTSTTGTGSLTLTGAIDEGQTFNTAYGLNRHFPYFAKDSTADTWECGWGHLSGTTTLVRDKITDTSSNGTTAFNFANAPDVYVSQSEQTSYVSPPAIYTGQRRVRCGNSMLTGVTSGLLNERFTGSPFWLQRGGLCTGATVYVTAGQTSAVLYMGIYEVDQFRVMTDF